MSMKRKADNISSTSGEKSKDQSNDSARATDDSNNEVTKSTVFVKNLPKGVTTEKVEEFFSDIGPVRKIILVTDKGSKLCNGLAYVNYTFPEDADTAIKKFHNKTFFDTENRVKVERAKKREPRNDTRKGNEKPQQQQERVLHKPELIPQRPQTPQKPTDPSAIDLHSIIIRNIPFKATEAILNDAFAKFGIIEKVTIPKKKDDPTKMKGFAVIRFKNIASAKKAVEQMNAKEIMKRTVAVDFMLPSNVYQEQVNKKRQEDIEKQEEEWENQRESEIKIQDDEDDLDDDDNDDADDANADDSDDDDLVNNQNEQDEEDDDENEMASTKFVDNAVTEGRVLFIKNLSFESTQEDVKQRFSEYGNVSKVFLVMDHVTDRPRGTAFVHFVEAASVENVLKDAYKKKKNDENMLSSIEIDGRPLIITKAVTRETAENMQKQRKNKNQKEDKRNLYLAMEGHIEKDSPAAEGVSKEDLEKRSKFYREKMLKLKNANFSVSPTRLSIRNIPKNVSEKDLRKIFTDAVKNAGEKNVHIKQVKLLNENASSGESKSKGIGFIEFASHNQALNALRNVNNNPTLFGAKKRPIVEFAIDDARRIHVMQVKREKEQNERKQKWEEERQIKRQRRENTQQGTEKPNKRNNDRKPNKQTTPKQSPSTTPTKQTPPKQKKEKQPKKKLKREDRLEQKEEAEYQKLVSQYKQNYLGLQ